MLGIRSRWARFWMQFAGVGFWGRQAAGLAGWAAPPFFGRYYLANMSPRGYISPRATIHHKDLRLGAHVFVDDDVLIYQDGGGGHVELRERVHINRYSIIQTGRGGHVSIGAGTYIQPRCQFSAYVGSIDIGSQVQIAPNCAFYPYNHGTAAGVPMREQPLASNGGIVIEDDVWLGYGVIVLDGVHIGRGAVLGAGSVVTRDIPKEAIAAGSPAKVIKSRS